MGISVQRGWHVDGLGRHVACGRTSAGAVGVLVWGLDALIGVDLVF